MVLAENINFAAAMRSSDLSHINLLKADGAGQMECTLDDGFFAALDQTEITGGDVRATVEVRHLTGGLYRITAKLSGKVQVECDRCLDPLWLETNVQEEIKVRDSKANNAFHNGTRHDDADGNAEDDCIEGDALDFDLSWPLYELVETSLPLQRTHAPEDCNPDMLGRIATDESADDGEDEGYEDEDAEE